MGLGSIPFGTVMDEQLSRHAVDRYMEAGGNLIDTSNFYGGGVQGSNTQMAGTAEKTVGEILKGRRDRFVIASKGFWLMEDEWTPNSVGLSRAYLTKNIEDSLRRLQTDYIDLYQCHNRDFYTPVEETLRVLNDFVRAGKIRYAGVSNWDGWHVVEAQMTARQAGLAPIVSNQIWYGPADRGAEHAIIPACRRHGVSIIAFGALAQGFLSGKYRRDGERSPRARKMTPSLDSAFFSWKNLANERNWNLLETLERIGNERERSIPTLALRWLLDGGACDVVLLGVSKLEQLEKNLEALDFQLTPAEIEAIRRASDPPKPYPNSFYELFCRKESPFYGGLRPPAE